MALTSAISLCAKWREFYPKGNVDLAISLHNVLKETTDSAGWLTVNDYMSPTCFLYLIERLLILSFCFHGCIFMTRSSCVEWLSYEGWCMGSSSNVRQCYMFGYHEGYPSFFSFNGYANVEFP